MREASSTSEAALVETEQVAEAAAVEAGVERSVDGDAVAAAEAGGGGESVVVVARPKGRPKKGEGVAKKLPVYGPGGTGRKGGPRGSYLAKRAAKAALEAQSS